MLIFQINPNELQKDQEVTGKDYLFWNAYLSERVKEDDYVLLPTYIDFITDTTNLDSQAHYLVELDDTDDEGVDI